MASRHCLPPGARGPVSDIPKPIRIGSAANAMPPPTVIAGRNEAAVVRRRRRLKDFWRTGIFASRLAGHFTRCTSFEIPLVSNYVRTGGGALLGGMSDPLGFLWDLPRGPPRDYWSLD